jgi:hypothetical protein
VTGLTAYALTQWLARVVGQIDAPGRTVEVWGGPLPRLDDVDDPEGHDDAIVTLKATAPDGRVDLLLIEVHGKTFGGEPPNTAVRTPLSVVNVRHEE